MSPLGLELLAKDFNPWRWNNEDQDALNAFYHQRDQFTVESLK